MYVLYVSLKIIWARFFFLNITLDTFDEDDLVDLHDFNVAASL